MLRLLLRLHEAPEAAIGLLECLGMAMQRSAAPEMDTVGTAEKGRSNQ